VLKSIDILIGAVSVVLLFSMAVTVLTGAIAALFNLRGVQLRKGLTDLLTHLDASMTPAVAKQIATAILKHPLIADSVRRLGTVIHRDELTTLLMDLGAGNSGGLKKDAAAALTTALKNNGIDNPQATLDSVRSISMILESTHPELATDARTTAAILEGAESKFVGKINAWFDQTIDRTAQRFTFHTRYIAFGCALIVAAGVQLDAISLLNRLALDDSFRAATSDAAKQLVDTADPTKSTSQSPDVAAVRDQYYKILSVAGLVVMPVDSEWVKQWSLKKVPGILLTAMLLTLGAPFWYNVLKNLLGLRSSLAQKDDQQRANRQNDTSGTTSGSGGSPAGPLPITGERGNLKAVG
jgi:hypothetical protein